MAGVDLGNDLGLARPQPHARPASRNVCASAVPHAPPPMTPIDCMVADMAPRTPDVLAA